MDNQTHFIQSLTDLLEGRRLRNQSYSLRALARDIEVDNACLVYILSGKKKVTPKIAYKLASAMNLEGKEMLDFILPSLQ